MADAASQAQADILRTLSAAARSMGGLPKDLEKTLTNIYSTQQSAVDKYQDHLKKVIKGDDAISTKRRNVLVELYKKEQELRDQLKLNTSAMSDATKNQQRITNQYTKFSKQRKAASDKIVVADTALANALHRGSIEEIKDARERLEEAKLARKDLMKEGAKIRQSRIAGTAELNKRGNAEKSMNGLLQNAIGERKSATKKLGGVWSLFGEKLRTGVQASLTKAFASFSMAKGATEIYTTVKSEISAGMSLGLKDYFATGFKFGLSPQEYVELNKANRDSVLAAGRNTDHMSELTKASAQYAGTIGDLAERTRFAQDSLTLLGESGIKPTAANLQSLSATYDNIRKMTSLTAAEFNSAMRDVTQEEGVQFQLKAANNEEERKTILAGIATRIAENRALGMTTKQAIEATKALAKLSGEGPLERFKKAAKLRAFGGAMGISGADEAAKILIKGARATEAEKAQLQGTISQMSNALSATGTGSMASELFATTAASTLGLEQLLGPTSAFNTRGAEALKIDQQQLDQLGEVSDNTKGIIDAIQRISGAAKSPGGQIVGGAAGWGLGAGALAGIGLKSVGSKILGGMGGLGGALGGIGGAIGGAGSKLKDLGMAGIHGIGGAIGGAGSKIKGMGKGVAGMSGKALGKSALKKIPILGALAGLGFAAGRAFEGDWAGAGMEAASGVASIVPGAGTSPP